MASKIELLFKKGIRDPSRDRSIQRKGANVFYRYRSAKESGRPVIAFQGGYTTHPAAWLGQINRFRGDFGIITMENRGHWHSGLGSSTPESYLKDMAEDLVSVMDKENVDRMTICGHSMWGGNAMKFYHMFPDRVSGLLLVAPAYMDPRKLGFLRDMRYLHPLTDFLAWASGGFGWLNGIKTKLLAERELSWKILRSALLFTYMRNAENPEHALKMIKNVYRADINAMSISMRALLLMDDELYERASEIKVPTMLFAGDEDPLISPLSVIKLAERIQSAFFKMFEHCAHFPMLSHSSIFNQYLAFHLENVAMIENQTKECDQSSC